MAPDFYEMGLTGIRRIKDHRAAAVNSFHTINLKFIIVPVFKLMLNFGSSYLKYVILIILEKLCAVKQIFLSMFELSMIVKLQSSLKENQ